MVIPYEKVCVVFDKDSFEKQNFNTAIEMGISNEYIVAWSNECFELWILEHFNYFCTDLSREDYFKKIGEILSEKSGKKYTYQKENPNNFNLIMQYGSLKKAINNSKRLLKEKEYITSYSDKKPATNVVQIVEMLIDETGYILE